jgi:glycosyltransferase involved in cell wall biosynthesis
VLCIDDGSRDDSVARLKRKNQADPRIKLLVFSRNFGKEAALSAGLANAAGDAVIPIDADLQHPPEIIPEMVAKWREGYDVVYAVRRERTGQGLMSRLQAHAFYWVFDKLSEVPLPREVGDFRLLDRKVVDAINAMPERTRFMKGIFAWVGFRQIGLPYDQEERQHGESSFGAMRLLRFAFDGLIAFSDMPLRMWTVIGAVVSGFAFFYIVVRLIRTLLYGIDVPGYESIIVIMLFLGGVQLITLGIIGHYLGRVFNEVKGRPLYIVRERLGVKKPD